MDLYDRRKPDFQVQPWWSYIGPIPTAGMPSAGVAAFYGKGPTRGLKYPSLRKWDTASYICYLTKSIGVTWLYTQMNTHFAASTAPTLLGRLTASLGVCFLGIFDHSSKKRTLMSDEKAVLQKVVEHPILGGHNQTESLAVEPAGICLSLICRNEQWKSSLSFKSNQQNKCQAEIQLTTGQNIPTSHNFFLSAAPPDSFVLGGLTAAFSRVDTGFFNQIWEIRKKTHHRCINPKMQWVSS